MPPSQAALETSWLRVQGPSDGQTCAWCRRWVGQVVPLEVKATYEAYHREHGGTAACRCSFEPATLRVDREDPGCAWG
jgi:hypothetical protein